MFLVFLQKKKGKKNIPFALISWSLSCWNRRLLEALWGLLLINKIQPSKLTPTFLQRILNRKNLVKIFYPHSFAKNFWMQQDLVKNTTTTTLQMKISAVTWWWKLWYPLFCKQILNIKTWWKFLFIPTILQMIFEWKYF